MTDTVKPPRYFKIWRYFENKNNSDASHVYCNESESIIIDNQLYHDGVDVFFIGGRQDWQTLSLKEYEDLKSFLEIL